MPPPVAPRSMLGASGTPRWAFKGHSPRDRLGAKAGFRNDTNKRDRTARPWWSRFRLVPVKLISMWVVAAVGVCGCSGSAQTKVSERFGLCAALPQGSTNTLTTRGPDYEMGRLALGGQAIEVYSGYQPDFPRRVSKTISQVSDGFRFADVENSGAVQKVLLWRKRTPDDAPLLVVLDGRDVLSALPSLQTPNFVANCP